MKQNYWLPCLFFIGVLSSSAQTVTFEVSGGRVFELNDGQSAISTSQNGDTISVDRCWYSAFNISTESDDPKPEFVVFDDLGEELTSSINLGTYAYINLDGVEGVCEVYEGPQRIATMILTIPEGPPQYQFVVTNGVGQVLSQFSPSYIQNQGIGAGLKDVATGEFVECGSNFNLAVNEEVVFPSNSIYLGLDLNPGDIVRASPGAMVECSGGCPMVNTDYVFSVDCEKSNEAAVGGTVSDDHGVSLIEGEVTSYAWSTTTSEWVEVQSSALDANGGFALTGLHGMTKLEYKPETASSYVNSYYYNDSISTLSLTQADTIELTCGATHQVVVKAITLPQPTGSGTIAGVVLDSVILKKQAVDVYGSTLYLVDAVSHALVGYSFVEVGGAFAFQDILDGQYLIVLSHQDYGQMSLGDTIAVNGGQEADLIVRLFDGNIYVHQQANLVSGAPTLGVDKYQPDKVLLSLNDLWRKDIMTWDRAQLYSLDGRVIFDGAAGLLSQLPQISPGIYVGLIERKGQFVQHLISVR